MQTTTRKQISARKVTLLLILSAPSRDGVDKSPILGTTRMQKLTFLAMEESRDLLKEDEVFKFDFQFDADRFGPADLDLYQDLELLKFTGWIAIDGESGAGPQGTPAGPESTDDQEGDVLAGFDLLLGEAPHGPRPLPEESEEAELSFDYLMGEHSEEIDLAEVEHEVEHVYAITDKGIVGLDRIRESSNKAAKFDALYRICANVKKEYGSWPLNVLLRHVYTAYPETTTKSEIRDQVLRR